MNYQLVGYVVANDIYIAILKNKDTGRLKHVAFGDIRYEQFHDRLGCYRSQDHMIHNDNVFTN